MPRALMSVSDKTKIAELAAGLAELGWDIVASGGTKAALEAAGLDVVPVSRVTNTPEMLGGRVKTLHPAIHGGILARDEQADLDELRELGFAPINLVVCNLYPFQEVIRDANVSLDDAIENIDIGGVTLLRAAAKNHRRVAAVVDPSDYDAILADLRDTGEIGASRRRSLAVKAYAHTRDYDTSIHAYLSAQLDAATDEEGLDESFAVSTKQTLSMRYGENPHQQAGFYANTLQTQPLFSELLGGKALSYNNILDADAAWRTAASFDPAQHASVVIVKHLTPTGVAIGESPETIFEAALASDPLSAFGGVIAVNRPINTDFVAALGSLFVEAIIAPDFAVEAVEKLREGRKNCRLLKIDTAQPAPKLEYRSVLGGVLVQERDYGDPREATWRIATERKPTPDEQVALKFAWEVVGHVKSNAIVLAKPNATVGIGGGLPSRVDAVELAVKKAGDNVMGAVLASDAFFPFPDAIEAAAAAGITAIVQPGGAMRDQAVIDAANMANIAMLLTGVRHFRH